MARHANLFALLDDEETDDVSSLAEHVAAKKKQQEEEEQQKRQQEEKERQARLAAMKLPAKPGSPAHNVKTERSKPNGYRQNYGQHNGYLPDGRKADANGRGGGRRQDNDGHRRNETDNSQRNRRNEAYNSQRKYSGRRSAGHMSNGNWQGHGQQEFDNRAPSIESNQKLDHQGREDGSGGWESPSEKVNDKKEILSIDGDNNSVGAEGNLPINSEKAKDSEPKKGKERQAYDDYYKNKAEEERAKRRAEEEEDRKKMTLQEYEKMLLEKRKALEDLKTEGREVKLDKDFESMQVVDKKRTDQVFTALNSEKDKLKKKIDGKDEKVRKPVSINEFLKPAEDGKQEKRVDRRQRFNGRQGNGKQEQGGHGINDNRKGYSYVTLKDDPLKIEDNLQFPALGGAAKASAQ